MDKTSLTDRGFQRTTIRTLFIITTLESLGCLILALSLPKSANNTWFLGYSPLRLGMILGLMLICLGLIWITLNIWRKQVSEQRWNTLLEFVVTRSRLLTSVLTILSAGLIIVVFLLVLWGYTTDEFFLGYLQRLSPILIFVGFAVFQMIAVLLYRADPHIRGRWLWSFLIAVMVALVHEWMLFRFHQFNNIFLILVMLLTTLALQALFRGSFQLTPVVRWGWIIAAAAVVIILYLQLYFIPKKFQVYQETFILLSPTVLVGLILITRLLQNLKHHVLTRTWGRFLLYVAILFGFIYLGNLYFQAGSEHAEKVNTTYAPNDDEESFMSFAQSVRLSNFKDTGSRNQMPVYPFIQALFYRPGMDTDEFFAHGKQINIVLSLFSLVILFLVFQRILPLHQTVNLILVIAFGLYVFKSGYFLVELTYYTLTALSYLLMGLMLVRPTIKSGVLTGFILGIGHLTKASVLPGLLIFICIYIGKMLIEVRRKSSDKKAPDDSDQPAIKTSVIALGLVVIIFLGVISPYLIESKRNFGRFFYNVNSTFYMWYDSWEEAIEGTIAHNDQKGWPDMPPEEIPGPGKYIRDHTISDVFARIKYGLNWQIQNIRYQYSFFNYPILFFVFAIFLFSLGFRYNLSIVKKYYPLIIFAGCYMVGYLFIYIWYSPIANSPRFIYSLYVPLLLSISITMKVLANKMNTPLIWLANVTVFGLALIDICYIVTQGPFYRDFGR